MESKNKILYDLFAYKYNALVSLLPHHHLDGGKVWDVLSPQYRVSGGIFYALCVGRKISYLKVYSSGNFESQFAKDNPKLVEREPFLNSWKNRFENPLMKIPRSLII